ncbi:hypothetical protein DFJ58DRAFT_842655 [Suillus subalutaceus]|uniref:uncharacterized protein n=1 Tax=Suillus subalutaceus TaxID=48586 RepID=UPI001B8716CE|nr:uncharacterized protein DFJ58DRAFT_842655 [Suillus subalutaceus]KAG1849448.1 hypothetical protein DFJ58DRAFT_842655 [Suillus subalutaceus]
MSHQRKTCLKFQSFSYKERGRLSQRKDLDVVYVTHKKSKEKRGKPSESQAVLIPPMRFHNKSRQNPVVHEKEQNLVLKNWKGFPETLTGSFMGISVHRNRYRELMRASRQWRDLMNRKQFGFWHDIVVKPGASYLALFCVVCPQPGINIPLTWQDQYESLGSTTVVLSWLADIWLYMDLVPQPASHGYMVTEADYQAHLLSAKESKKRFSCSNHHAVNTANANRSNQIRATGVAATACACHGCFVSHTVVDFQKDERVSVVYSFCGVYQQLPRIIAPQKREILTAVGKFHLSTHKLPCFARFSLNFIKGAGQVDGEILETFGASFNEISPTAQSMSQYHRQEIFDDHMRDSNWKKLVGIIKTLLKKHKCAVKGEKDEKIAAELQGEHLDIYHLKINKAPTMAEIWLRLTELETSEIGRPGSISWIIQEGIELDTAEADEQAWEVADEDDSELIDEEIPAEDMGIWMPSSKRSDWLLVHESQQDAWIDEFYRVNWLKAKASGGEDVENKFKDHVLYHMMKNEQPDNWLAIITLARSLRVGEQPARLDLHVIGVMLAKSHQSFIISTFKVLILSGLVQGVMLAREWVIQNDTGQCASM